MDILHVDYLYIRILYVAVVCESHIYVYTSLQYTHTYSCLIRPVTDKLYTHTYIHCILYMCCSWSLTAIDQYTLHVECSRTLA